MKKKLLAILLATSMVLGVSACGSSTAESSGEATETATEAGTEAKEESTESAGTETAAADIDTSEHVVISYMFTGDKPEGAALDRLNEMMGELNAILTEKVKAE